MGYRIGCKVGYKTARLGSSGPRVSQQLLGPACSVSSNCTRNVALGNASRTTPSSSRTSFLDFLCMMQLEDRPPARLGRINRGWATATGEAVRTTGATPGDKHKEAGSVSRHSVAIRIATRSPGERCVTCVKLSCRTQGMMGTGSIIKQGDEQGIFIEDLQIPFTEDTHLLPIRETRPLALDTIANLTTS